MLIFYCKCLSIWMQGGDCIPWIVKKSLPSIWRKCAAWGQSQRNVSRNLYLSPAVLNFTIHYETLWIIQINTYFALKLFSLKSTIRCLFITPSLMKNLISPIWWWVVYCILRTLQNWFSAFFTKTHTFSDGPIRRTLSKHPFAASQRVSCSWPMLFPFASCKYCFLLGTQNWKEPLKLLTVVFSYHRQTPHKFAFTNFIFKKHWKWNNTQNQEHEFLFLYRLSEHVLDRNLIFAQRLILMTYSLPFTCLIFPSSF